MVSIFSESNYGLEMQLSVIYRFERSMLPPADRPAEGWALVRSSNAKRMSSLSMPVRLFRRAAIG